MKPRNGLARLLSIGLLGLMLAGNAASQSRKPASALDSISDPCPVCRFDFGVFGLVRSQTARLNVVEAGDVPPGPCRRAELRFLDSQGNTLAQSVECLTPGRAVALVFNGGSLESLRSEIRGQVRYAPADETSSNRGNIVVTTEVFDNATGRTAFLVPVSPPSDFAIVVSPGFASVMQGTAAIATVSSFILSGSAQSISLSVSGEPAGVSVSFSPPTVTSGGSSTLTVVPSLSTPPGTYPLTIQGTGTSTSHSVAFTLNVTGR